MSLRNFTISGLKVTVHRWGKRIEGANKRWVKSLGNARQTGSSSTVLGCTRPTTANASGLLSDHPRVVRTNKACAHMGIPDAIEEPIAATLP